MAAQATQVASSLPLYRMDAGTYTRLIEAGTLDGVEVELLGGLLVDKHSHRDGLPVHRLDVGTYKRMVDSGVLEGRHVELLEGLLVEMSPQGEDHAKVIRRLTRHLASAHAWLGVQLPLETEWGSLPEPDLVLTEGEPPAGRHPRTALLVIEVAVTSHDRDRDTKARLYAWAGIPTYWLVDVPGKTIEARTDLDSSGYRGCKVYEVGMSVPVPDPGVADVDVGELLADVGG